VSILCYKKKSKQQNCKALQKQRFSQQDEKNLYGKADAYHRDFLKYWVKRLLLKRILSYEAPPLPRVFVFAMWMIAKTLDKINTS